MCAADITQIALFRAASSCEGKDASWYLPTQHLHAQLDLTWETSTLNVLALRWNCPSAGPEWSANTSRSLLGEPGRCLTVALVNLSHLFTLSASLRSSLSRVLVVGTRGDETRRHPASQVLIGNVPVLRGLAQASGQPSQQPVEVPVAPSPFSHVAGGALLVAW